MEEEYSPGAGGDEERDPWDPEERDTHAEQPTSSQPAGLPRTHKSSI